jgi:hypothetical protein
MVPVSDSFEEIPEHRLAPHDGQPHGNLAQRRAAPSLGRPEGARIR